MLNKKQVILHHTAISRYKYANGYRRPQQFEIVNNSHKANWGEAVRSTLGYYGGYHYLIEETGKVMQYRREEERGAHCYVPGFDYNKSAIGICVAGDLRNEVPSEEQIESLTTLVVDIQRRYGIPSTQVYHHWDLKPTQCPGIDLRELLEEQQQKDLKSRLGRFQKALPRARGARKRRLQRLIARIFRWIEV